jgi:hypothetical protein
LTRLGRTLLEAMAHKLNGGLMYDARTRGTCAKIVFARTLMQVLKGTAAVCRHATKTTRVSSDGERAADKRLFKEGQGQVRERRDSYASDFLQYDPALRRRSRCRFSEAEPGTVSWVAIRVSFTAFSVFEVFYNEPRLLSPGWFSAGTAIPSAGRGVERY